LRRPAAFSADPEQPGSRFYRSGDLGHIDAAGSLHFVGRNGNRVKVRGHSVGTMEIEAALCACPGAMRAAVLARSTEVPTGPVRLVAYVVAGRDADRDPPLPLLDPPDRLLAGGYSQMPEGQFVK
jgi:acyl-coenzyme A synthetase/AMP-(fatty) acid ligase